MVINSSGAESRISKSFPIKVFFSGLVIGERGLSFKNITLALFSFFIVILCVGIFLNLKFLKMRKKIIKEVKEAEKSLAGNFQNLKEKIENELKILEGVKSLRELNEEEKKITDDLKEALKISEKYIAKEIKDIESEI